MPKLTATQIAAVSATGGEKTFRERFGESVNVVTDTFVPELRSNPFSFLAGDVESLVGPRPFEQLQSQYDAAWERFKAKQAAPLAARNASLDVAGEVFAQNGDRDKYSSSYDAATAAYAAEMQAARGDAAEERARALARAYNDEHASVQAERDEEADAAREAAEAMQEEVDELKAEKHEKELAEAEEEKRARQSSDAGRGGGGSDPISEWIADKIVGERSSAARKPR